LKRSILLSIIAGVSAFGASVETLESITVTAASKAAQKLESVTSNIEVITADEIEERRFTSVTEALSSLSGAGFVQNGGMGTTTSLFIQGFDTKYTLVLIDGVKYNNLASADGGAELAHLLISDVERIEVIKGANPIWGADAAAGVVNIVTKKAQKGFSSHAHAMVGSYNTKSFEAGAKYGRERYDLAVSASRYLTDGFSAQAPKGKRGDEFERDGYQNTTANLKAGYNVLKNLRVEGEYYAIRGAANYDGYMAPNSVKRSGYDYDMYKAAALFDTDSHHISFQASKAESKRDELDETSPFSVKIFKGDVRNYELKDDFKYAWFGTLTAGAAVEDMDIRYSKYASSEVKKNDTTRAVFVSNTVSHKGLTLTGAARYDDYTSFGAKTTGKVGAKYALNSDVSFFTNYGLAFKTPTLTQMMNPWGSSNFDLKPEDIKSFDASAAYKNLSFTYFYNTVQNLINWQGSGYQNIDGTSKLQGYELKAKTQIADSLVLSGLYTRLHAVDGSGKELARRAHDSASLNVDWYPNDALHAGVYSSFVGTRFDTNTKAVQTGNYALINGVVNYKFDKTISGYLKLENLLDREYQSVDGYATAGRSFYLGLKAAF